MSWLGVSQSLYGYDRVIVHPGRALMRKDEEQVVSFTVMNVLLSFIPQFFLEFIAVVTLVAIVNYWLLFPTFVMSLLFYFLRHIYINTARSIKRLEALSEYLTCQYLQELI